MKRLARELKALKDRTVFLTHSLADLDAVASAIVFAELFGGEARCVDSINSQSKHCLERLGLPLLEPVNELNGFDNVVLVDVSNADLLGDVDLNAFKGKVFFVDHHYHSKHVKAEYGFADQHRSSTSEIVLEISNELKKPLSETQKQLLLAGVYSDTAGFKSANTKTFKAFAELLEGVDYARVLELVEGRKSFGERIAVLRCAARAETEKVGECLVASSHSHAFELQCASGLVALGCDYAFVANEKEGRLSGVKADNAPGNIGKIMEAAGRVFKGSGGGHEKVGGAKGEQGLTGKALKDCVVLAKKELENQ